MLDLLWFLLPLAAFSGWYVARREYKRDQEADSYQLPIDYYKGLNYILSEQPDKAIDVFLRLSELDGQTMDIHLALGSLFRKRGEVDRAIRLHQGLVNQPSLSTDLYIHALQELAIDYMSAGLLDRAERLCLELVDVNNKNTIVLNLLLDIYQQEKEWFRAIDVARRISELTSKSCSSKIAHYYCELAAESKKQNDLAQVQRMLQKALSEDASCARAIIALGMQAKESQEFDVAIKHFQALETVAPAYFSEVLPALQYCYQAAEKPQDMLAYLKRVATRIHSVEVVLGVGRILKAQEGEAPAAEYLKSELIAHPSLRGVQFLLDINIENSQEEIKASYLGVVKESLDKLLLSKPVYRCAHCGFSGVEMHWCCPSCRRWSSIQPIQEFQWGSSI